MSKTIVDIKKLRILIITSSFPRTSMGLEGGFIWKSAVNFQKKGLSVVILCPHRPGAPLLEEWEGVIIHRFPYIIPFQAQKLTGSNGMIHVIREFPLVALEMIPYLVSCILYSLYLTLKYHPDIIHSHWIIPTGIAGAFVNVLCKIPHISSVHGTDITISVNNHLFSSLIKVISQCTQSITTNSTFTSQILSVILPNHKPFSTIPMGIHCELDESRIVTPIEEKNLILYVGRLIDWKGVHVLISAMKKVIQTKNQARVVVVGDGPEKENLIYLVEKWNLEGVVHFAGRVPDPILQDYYNRAAVFVLPSITVKNQTEGLGVVLLEAMAAGVPVIGSRTGGIPDIIQDGENGLLFSPGDDTELADAIIRIITNPTFANRLRNQGLQTIQDKFSWDKITDQFIKEYQTIIRM